MYPEGHDAGDLYQMKGAYPKGTIHCALWGMTHGPLPIRRPTGTGPSGEKTFRTENLEIPAFCNWNADRDRLLFPSVREIYSHPPSDLVTSDIPGTV